MTQGIGILDFRTEGINYSQYRLIDKNETGTPGFLRFDQRFPKFHAYFEMLKELQSVHSARADLVMSGAAGNAIISREIEKTIKMIYAARNNGLSP